MEGWKRIFPCECVIDAESNLGGDCCAHSTISKQMYAVRTGYVRGSRTLMGERRSYLRRVYMEASINLVAGWG